MTSSWLTLLVTLTWAATSTKAQEFSFAGPSLIITNEGQPQPLFLEIQRSGSSASVAKVTLSAFEVTDNYSFQWFFEVALVAGQSTLTLPLGVVSDDIANPDRVYIFTLSNATDGHTVGATDSVVVTYVDNDSPMLFDCRSGGVCQNGGVCNSVSGRCDCVNAVFADCSLNIDDFGPTACAATSCNEAGACVADATSASGSRCVCQPSFFGPSCDSKRYNVKCFGTRMCLNVQPPASYQGARYVRNYGGVAGCNMNDVTPAAIAANELPENWQGSYICLDNEGSQCGDPAVTVEADGDSTRSREVIVRQNILRTKYDIIFTGHCKYNAEGVLYLDQDNIDRGFGGIFIEDRDVVTPAAVFVVDPVTGQQISVSSVKVGDDICYAMVLEDGFSGIRLDNVLANDTMTSPQTYEVLRDGCPVPNTVSVVSKLPFLPTPGDPRSVQFCISAFGFDTSNKVGLRFEVSICTQDNANCQPYTCDETQQSYGRRKREAGEKLEILDTVYVVNTDDSDSPNADAQTGDEPSGPKLSALVTSALAAMGVICLVLLVVTIFLLIRSTRSRDSDRS